MRLDVGLMFEVKVSKKRRGHKGINNGKSEQTA